jgi:Zn-dependent M32 family carboxypeptidase
LNPFEVSELKYENRKIRLEALTPLPKLEVAGFEVGPFEAGERFETYSWIGEELIKSKVAKLEEAEEELTLAELQKVRLMECFQQSRRLGKLPENFYPKLRRLLRKLEVEYSSNPEKHAEFKQASRWALDIVSIRLNKILALASAHERPSELLKNLSEEELTLYRKLHDTIDNWRKAALL